MVCVYVRDVQPWRLSLPMLISKLHMCFIAACWKANVVISSAWCLFPSWNIYELGAFTFWESFQNREGSALIISASIPSIQCLLCVIIHTTKGRQQRLLVHSIMSHSTFSVFCLGLSAICLFWKHNLYFPPGLRIRKDAVILVPSLPKVLSYLFLVIIGERGESQIVISIFGSFMHVVVIAVATLCPYLTSLGVRWYT